MLRRVLPGGTLALAAVLTFTAPCPSARAQDGDEGRTVIDDWADAIVASQARHYDGPEVDWPDPTPRPEAAGIVRSLERPVNVQVGPWVTADRAEAALRGLEIAHDFMVAHDWPLPWPDGGRGGTAGFDLYLMVGDSDVVRPIHPSHDVPHLHQGFDAVVPYVRVDDDLVARSRLESCSVSAYVQAALLGVDPAEAPGWRVATGDYLAWLITGHFGCGEEGVARQQQESFRTWVGHDEASGEGGALFLAMLSARTDGLTGDFIRDLWTGTVQRTWEGDRLRAAPDMWQVVNAVMEVGEDPLNRFIEEVAVARYFAGSEARRVGTPLAMLRDLPEDAEVPVSGRASWDEMPRRFEPRGLELEPYGSAYLEVDTSSAPAGSLLRIWLRGELGVGWSLTAVRLAEDGTERGRVRAPVRPDNPRSYIPLELTDDETARVVVVVTNMGLHLPDADDTNDQVRSFRVIFDRELPGQ